jgi:hypothetical protein
MSVMTQKEKVLITGKLHVFLNIKKKLEEKFLKL